MDRALIRKLSDAAYNIGFNVVRGFPQDRRGDFSSHDWNTPPRWETDGNNVTFFFGDERFAQIRFTNIRPAKVFEGTVSVPVRSNERTKDVNAITVTNDTDRDIERTYTTSTTHVSTRTTSMEHEVGLRIKATFGVAAAEANGGTTALGEIETTYSFKHSASEQEQDSETKESSVTVTCRPQKRTHITTRKSTARLSQDVTLDVLMDFDIALDSHGDWTFNFTSLDDLYQFMQGVDGNTHPIGVNYRTNPNNYILPDVHRRFRINMPIEFDHATTGDIVVSEDDL